MEEKKIASETAAASWFPVDNAANLYCMSKRGGWARTLRLSVVLNEAVKPELLQQALDEVCARIPTFCAVVRSGLFWNYFERTTARVLVKKETDYPGRPIKTEDTLQPNFRILYYQKRVTLEVFHGVTDGGGCIRFLMTLIARYYELQGVTVEDSPHILRTQEKAAETETEDPFLLSSSGDAAAKNYQQADVFYQKRPWNRNYMRVIHGMCRVDDLKNSASRFSLTVTEFLTAILIYTYIQTTPKPIEKPISISIPLDLRRRFGTESMRNFCYMSDISFDPVGRHDVAFSEICESIAGMVQNKASLEYLTQEINQNVRAQKSPLLRVLPYPLKRLFLMNTYRKNQRSFTTFLSNIGEIDAPPALLRHINRAEFTLGETPFHPRGIGVVSVGGLLTVTFNDCTDDVDLQRCFFRVLASQGVPVRIESNRK